MKLSNATVGFVFALGCFCDKPLLNYFKITRVDFKNEGPSCVKPFCSVRHVSRYQSFLDIGCERLETPWTKIFLNHTFAIKANAAKNFRQFVQMKNVDVCAVLEDVSKSPFAEELRKFNDTFSGFLHTCPYKSNKLYNVTFGAGWNQKDEPNVNPLPNGIYRHHIVLTDDLKFPMNRVNVTIFAELRVHSFNFRVNI